MLRAGQLYFQKWLWNLTLFSFSSFRRTSPLIQLHEITTKWCISSIKAMLLLPTHRRHDCWMSSPSPQSPKFRSSEHIPWSTLCPPDTIWTALAPASAKVLFAYSDYTNSFILPGHPLQVLRCTQKNSMFRFIQFPLEKWVVSESVRPRVFVGICWESQSVRHGRASLFMKN